MPLKDLNEIVNSMRESTKLVEKTAENLFQVALKMQRIEKELKRSFQEDQDKRAKLALKIFHSNSCFTLEEKKKQYQNDFLIVDDKDLIIFCKNRNNTEK